MQLTSQQFAEVVACLRKAGTSDGSEKRKFTRMEVQAKIHLAFLSTGSIGRRYTGLSRDVSAGGMGLMQHAAVERGEELLIILPCDKEQLHVAGKVIFCRPLADGMFGLGVEFQRMAEGSMGEQMARVAASEMERIRQSILD